MSISKSRENFGLLMDRYPQELHNSWNKWPRISCLVMVPQGPQPSLLNPICWLNKRSNQYISSCNTILHIKNLMRIVSHFNDFISPTQTAFMSNWRAMLGQELVKNCHREGSSARYSARSTTRTYDSIYFLYFRDDWFAFTDSKIGSSFVLVFKKKKVPINGSLEAYFDGRKGLLQGDPLSVVYHSNCLSMVQRYFLSFIQHLIKL